MRMEDVKEESKPPLLLESVNQDPLEFEDVKVSALKINDDEADKPNFIEDFESQIDSLIESKPIKNEIKTESVIEDVPVATKAKRTPRKRRQKPKDESSSEADSDVTSTQSKRQRTQSDNGSVKSNAEESEDNQSLRSRRSSRKSRPNNFYTNYELESASGSEKEMPDEEYIPIKEKKTKQTKSPSVKKVKRKLHTTPEDLPEAVNVVLPDLPSAKRNLTNNDSSKDPLAEPKISSTSPKPAELNGLTEIKITSVSSIAAAAPPGSAGISSGILFKEIEVVHSACSFIKEALVTTAELGNLLNSKSNEFVEKKATETFITDTRKLQFCMEKAFVLFNLARNNISGIEKKLKDEYAQFVMANGLNNSLKADKNSNAFLFKHNISLVPEEAKSCPVANADSDSDCEIVEEASMPRVGTNKKKAPELDILRRVEKNGISWRANKGGSVSSDSDGVRVNLPGKSTVWINKDICVKKVAPSRNSNQSFFREDGRTLKPPDIRGLVTSTEHLHPVDKTSLVLGWLNLTTSHIERNLHTTLKKIEKRKRRDSCSDLGESCSDDDSDHTKTYNNNLFPEHNTNSNDPTSLLKLCLSTFNTFLLFEEKKRLEDKFNFRLFDDMEEPEEYKVRSSRLLYISKNINKCKDNNSKYFVSPVKEIVKLNINECETKAFIDILPSKNLNYILLDKNFASQELNESNRMDIATMPAAESAPTVKSIANNHSHIFNNSTPEDKSNISENLSFKTPFVNNLDSASETHLNSIEKSEISSYNNLKSGTFQSNDENIDSSNILETARNDIENPIISPNDCFDVPLKSKSDETRNLVSVCKVLESELKEIKNNENKFELSSMISVDLKAENVKKYSKNICQNDNNLNNIYESAHETIPKGEEDGIILKTDEIQTGTENIDTSSVIDSLHSAFENYEIKIVESKTRGNTNNEINSTLVGNSLETTIELYKPSIEALEDNLVFPKTEEFLFNEFYEDDNDTTLVANFNDTVFKNEEISICDKSPFPKIEDLQTGNNSDDDINKTLVGTYFKSEGSDIESPLENDLLTPINSEIVETGAGNIKSSPKLEKALKYLLQSSSSDSSDSSCNLPRKKKFTKRAKKAKITSLEKSSSSVPKSPIPNESNEDFRKYNHLKTDPVLKYKCSVKVCPLSAEVLKPFEEYLREIEKDVEIDRLVDLSSLNYKRPTDTVDEHDLIKPGQAKEVNRKASGNTRKPVRNLVEFLNSSHTSETESLLETPNKSSNKEETVEETIEDMARKFTLQSNNSAKDMLFESSSNESFDESSSASSAEVSKKGHDDTGKKETSTPKKNTKESKNDLPDPDLKTPTKKTLSGQPRSKPDEFLMEISTMLRGVPKSIKKLTPRSTENEERLWLTKRNRLLSKQQRRIIKSSSSSGSETRNNSDESDSSSGTVDSQILQTPTTTPSKSRSGMSCDNSSQMSTPITPKTRNFLAHTDLLSSDSYDDKSSSDTSSPNKSTSNDAVLEETPSKGRKNIRKMIKDNYLMDTTKLAAKEEEERLQRLSDKSSQLSELISQIKPASRIDAANNATLILDFDVETKTPLVTVHPALVTILKPHQIDGVKFMWDTCLESTRMVNDGKPGGGCILAHCMGLGKSLTVIALIHAILASPILPLRTVLICCPLSTVLNWADEFYKWLRKTGDPHSIKVFELSKFKKNYERGFHLEDWHKTGGVFIIGYEMFRLLTTMKEGPDVKPHVINKIHTTLLNPGPDLVVCDEGHLLKNDNTALAKVMNKITSKRRIVLTGTPLQNNLKEYYCMVNFVKPNLLGSRREYFNRFENPISNGQHRDSSLYDIKIMKKRSHVLHKMLEGSVQRKEASILYNYLPRKQEYVLFTTLTKCQIDIYQHYLNEYSRSNNCKGASLLKDFHILQKIWTHPRTLQHFLLKSRNRKKNTEVKKKRSYVKRMAIGGFVCLEDDDLIPEETLAEPDDSDWWLSYVDEKALECLETSHKFSVTFNLLDECLLAGDKMLIFSTSLFTLDALEYFLKKTKGWKLGHNYYRLDGSVTLENRQNWCRQFNSDRNKDVKLFLISTRAGGLGINMIAANRVIIMDVSWNPSHDIQSIFRVYRFGQKKDCYIYRIVALGTMEEKMYERSVTKQAVSCRVVDEQQIDRHYNMADLSELYFFNPVPCGPQPVPSFPSDHVLATVLASNKPKSNMHLTSDTGDAVPFNQPSSDEILSSEPLMIENDIKKGINPSDEDNRVSTDPASNDLSNKEGSIVIGHNDNGNRELNFGPMSVESLPFIWSMHEHDSLLRDLHEEQLDEDDRRVAWQEYEAEREQHQQMIAAMKLHEEMKQQEMRKKMASVFPVGNIIPNQSRMMPMYPPLAMASEDGSSILPDTDNNRVCFRPVAVRNKYSHNPNPFPTYNSQSRPANNLYNPVAPKAYVLGRYNPSGPKTLVPQFANTKNDAFKKIQISNVTGYSENTTKAAGRKKNSISYFPSDKASTSSSVMDLTSLPETPDRGKPSGRRKSTSGKKGRKKLSGRTPKKSSPKKSTSNPKQSFNKKLDFENDHIANYLSSAINVIKSSQSAHDPKDSPHMETIELE